MLTGMIESGWGKKGEDTLMGVDLAKQSLELITGYKAMSTGPTDEACK